MSVVDAVNLVGLLRLALSHPEVPNKASDAFDLGQALVERMSLRLGEGRPEMTAILEGSIV